MSQLLELPDPVFTALQRAATARGVTPAVWIAAHLEPVIPHQESGTSPAKTMADRFAGRTGVIASTGAGDWSEKIAERFTNDLEMKKKAGHL